MGIGPIEATRLVLKKTGLSLSAIDLVELNEAFASQSLACIRELGLDPEKVNVNGGAIALGHPISGTGGVILTKLIYELRRSGKELGLATMCLGGGQGVAIDRAERRVKTKREDGRGKMGMENDERRKFMVNLLRSALRALR